MRITTGLYKNRRLMMPKGIRPTQDKVRKALFDILGDVANMSFLELFAGSGAVGLEAASRGAAPVVMIESRSECVRAIRRNIELLKEKNAVVFLQDAEKAMKMMEKTGKRFDIIFLDPPYQRTGAAECRPVDEERGTMDEGRGKREEAKGSRDGGRGMGEDGSAEWGAPAKKALHILGRCDILARNGLVIVQHHKKESLPDSAGCVKLQRQSRYGDTVLSFYGAE